jgi:hypothetical protein
MSLRRLLTVTVLALPMSGILSAAAFAGAGGAAPGTLTLPGPQPTVVQIGNPIASASGNGVSIAVRSTAILHGTTHVRGTAPAGTPGGVRIERLDPVAGWVTVVTAPVSATGTFDAAWKPDHVGATQLRAEASGAAAGAAAVTSQVAVAVYRRGVASWYGPGLYGTSTACGVVLHHKTLGVAHRSLPCGTPVSLYYRGRTIVVPVIDRGPYVHGRSWDLTIATFRALGGSRADGILKLGALRTVPATAPTTPAAPAPAG